jgi:hypothetical protein
MSVTLVKTAPSGPRLRDAIDELIRSSLPGSEVLEVRAFDSDTSHDDATTKAIGYGEPLRVVLRDANGRKRTVVLHSARSDGYGHDRRADRAASMLLAFDTFSTIPGHVRAIDVGAVDSRGRLISLNDAGEFFLLTTYAEGHPYAEDLRAIADRARASAADVARAQALAVYLANLHTPVVGQPEAYARAVRDLLGSGEGIFGIVDGYPRDTPGAPPARLAAIERSCLEWRWRLRCRERRLARIHGDFHPFNILFDDQSRLSLLDTSRGSTGDPADDLGALAINYVFFALLHPGTWQEGFRPLWHALWSTYARERNDPELLDVVAPFLTWRALVVANPRWYPDVRVGVRDRLLHFVEVILAQPRFDLMLVDELFYPLS